MLMLIILFALLVFVFGKILMFAIRAAWGLVKTLLAVVPLPLILIALAFKGFIWISFLILAIVGLLAMMKLD